MIWAAILYSKMFGVPLVQSYHRFIPHYVQVPPRYVWDREVFTTQNVGFDSHLERIRTDDDGDQCNNGGRVETNGLFKVASVAERGGYGVQSGKLKSEGREGRRVDRREEWTNHRMRRKTRRGEKFVRFERDFDPFTGRYERGDYRRRTGEASVGETLEGPRAAFTGC